MILKNLVVSVCILSLLGSISFGDDAIDTVDTVAVGSLVPEAAAAPIVEPGVGNIPETPSSGMDPTVRQMYLSTIAPTIVPLIADNGGFIVSSVESYTVGIGVSSCSFIARKNLLDLLKVLEIPDPWIAQGDALDLIEFGKYNRTLTSFQDKMDVIPALDRRRVDFYETVFDVYRYVPTRSRALQGHRVTVFLGEDDQWYLLDTLDGAKTTSPQLFSSYLENDIDDAEWLVRTPGYSRVRFLSHDGTSRIFPFLSSELQLFLRPDLIALEDNATTEILGQHADEMITPISA